MHISHRTGYEQNKLRLIKWINNHNRRLICVDECCIAPAVPGTQREYYPEISTHRVGLDECSEKFANSILFSYSNRFSLKSTPFCTMTILNSEKINR